VILVLSIVRTLVRIGGGQILGMDINPETLVPVGIARVSRVEETAGMDGPDRVVGDTPAAARELWLQGLLYSVAPYGMRTLRRIYPIQSTYTFFESVVSGKET